MAPRPVQARLPIMIGGCGPKKTLRTLARYGDQWNAMGSLEKLKASVTRSFASTARRWGGTRARSSVRPRSTSSSATAARPRRMPTRRDGGTGEPLRRDWTWTSWDAGGDRRGPPAIRRARVPAHPRGHPGAVRSRDDRPHRRGPRAASTGDGMKGSVVALAGGVGGAKLADGLQAQLGDRLAVIVNTGDDCRRHGLLVMPDHDTVLYNLAGIEQVAWGWGIEGDTHAAMAQLGVYGEETWFGLGDRDLALHIARTARVRAGGRADRRLPRRSSGRWGSPPGSCRWPTSPSRPRSAPPTAGWSSRSTSSTGARRRTCSSCGSRGSPRPRPRRRFSPRSPGPRRSYRAVEPARLGRADPRRAGHAGGDRGGAGAGRRRCGASARSSVAGRSRAPRTGCSSPLGHEASALGVARLYAGPVDVFVIDTVDAGLAPAVEALGLRPVVTDTIMTDDAPGPASRARCSRRPSASIEPCR